MSTIEEIERAESLQIQIESRLGISKPHLPASQAAPLLKRAFESLAFLDSRVVELGGLIADQERLLARL